MALAVVVLAVERPALLSWESASLVVVEVGTIVVW